MIRFNYVDKLVNDVTSLCKNVNDETKSYHCSGYEYLKKNTNKIECFMNKYGYDLLEIHKKLNTIMHTIRLWIVLSLVLVLVPLNLIIINKMSISYILFIIVGSISTAISLYFRIKYLELNFLVDSTICSLETFKRYFKTIINY